MRLSLKRLQELMAADDGNLDLKCTPLDSLPDNLTVEGNLDLRYTDVETLPSSLIVKGWLDLRHTKIKVLPDNVVVLGKVYFNENKKVLSDCS